MFQQKVEPQLIQNQPDEIYHGQKDFLSSTMIRKFIQEGPFAFWDAAVNGYEIEPSEAMEFGTIVHAAILEPERFKSKYKVVPEFMGLTQEGKMSAQSKAAKEKRAAWMSDQPPDTIIVTEEQLDRLTHVVESFMEHETARKIIQEGSREVSGFFNDKETGLAMKIRPDFLSHDFNILSDLKTCRDPSARGFERAIINGGYHIQLAFYIIGVEQITGIKPQIPNFIAIQNQRPFEVCVWVADDYMIEAGIRECKKATEEILECINKNNFPRLQTKSEMITLPRWAIEE